jgi:hypothetical protein
MPMNWSSNKSLALSRVCVAVFAALLAALDVAAYWLVRWFLVVSLGLEGTGDEIFLLAVIYLCSAFAWALLWQLWRLLGELRAGRVFTDGNVRRLRASSWCCVGVFAVCGLAAVHYVPFAAFSAAAGFMALIVRIVKNVFEQALAMKSELDLTI